MAGRETSNVHPETSILNTQLCKKKHGELLGLQKSGLLLGLVLVSFRSLPRILK